ncbi:MFS transporter [Brevibacterium album]|uniref:MFS transporter n=1 Tax=Brevibacterium album TaxID=417948 RepID=UPI0004033A9D|nr:MFS transporter [Brevibacterium album]
MTKANRAPGTLLLVLVAAMGAGPLLNFALAALSSQVTADYGITEGQYGFIITTVFLLAGISSVLLGDLADRIPVRVQIALIFGLLIAGFLVSITAPTYAALVAAAVIAGPAQAFANPATNRIIAAHVPLAKRGAWMGWKQSGVQFGLLFAGVTVPFVGGLAGWTGVALMCVCLLGVLLVLGWLVISRLPGSRDTRETVGTEPEADSPPAETAPAESGPGPAPETGPASGASKLSLAVWLLAICSFLNAVGTQGVNAYASLFAVQTVDYPIELAGTMLAIIGVLGIVARNVWGRIAGRLSRPAALIQVMSLGGILTAGGLIATEHTHLEALMWVGVALHAFFPLAANVVINSGVVAAAPPGRIGVASGLVAAGMNLGFAAGPAVVGLGIDLTGAYTPGWIALAVVYLLCFGVAVVLGRVDRPGRDAD